MKVITTRRAVSSVMATVILLAVSIAGALAVNQIFGNAFWTLVSRGQVAVESISLNKQTDGAVVFAFAVKNTGNKPVVSLSVKLGSEEEAYFPTVSKSSPLQPGRSAAILLASGNGLKNDYISSQSYTAIVKAVFADGNTFVTTTSVACFGEGATLGLLTANIDFNPNTLNLWSHGTWVSVFIELPSHDVSDIAISSILINGRVPVDPKAPTAIGDHNNNGVPDLMVKFERSAVSQLILSKGIASGNVTITVEGQLRNGERFTGNDVIQVLT